MHRRLLAAAVLATLAAAPPSPAAPRPVPAALKTLESLLGPVDVPASGTGGGVQPLHSAVAAADALLRSLDPSGHSGAQVEAPGEAPEGAASSGVILGRDLGYPVVAGTLPGSPASKTTLREGDRLLEINDHAVTWDDRLDALAAMLTGEEGAKLELVVLSADRKSTQRHSLELEKLSSSVHVRVLPGGVGYARLLAPDPLVLAEYKLRLGKLASEDLVGIVLDLRSARGGRPEDAAAIASPFLEKDTKLARVLEGTSKDRTLRDDAPGAFDCPVVVLVSPATDGAAELAAGALQAARRAVLLGADTLGAAPAYRQLEQGGAHLTVPKAVVELASGALLTGRGLRPDIAVRTEAVPRKLARNLAGQAEAFAEGKKWEPPKEKSETDKQLEDVLGEDEKDDKPEPEEEKKEDEAEEDAEAEDGPRDPFKDYPLLKRYDTRLVRSVHLLVAANIFLDQARK